MIKSLLVWAGMFHIFFVFIGFLDLLHYRLYIGIEDKVIISKAEYDEFKIFKASRHP